MKYLYVGAMAEVDAGGRGGDLRAAGGGVRRAGAADGIARPRISPTTPARRQYGSIPVLETLVERCPADALKLLAVTERDLFIPVLTFVFGQAQLGGRVAVVSLARLRQEFYGLPPNREVFLERALKEALHETGHTVRAGALRGTGVAPCRWRPTSGRSI